MRVRYRAVFLSGQDSVNTYRCIPAGDDVASTVGLKSYPEDPEKTARQNAALLETAFNDLTTAHAEGRKLRLIVPINACSFETSVAGGMIISAIKNLDEEMRKQVIPLVHDLRMIQTEDYMADITIPLLPFFDYYMAEPSPGGTDFTVFASNNYFAVSLNLSANMDDGNDDDTTQSVLTTFWAAATKRRLKIYVQGISTAEQAATVKRYEAFAMDGPLLSGDLETLGG